MSELDNELAGVFARQMVKEMEASQSSLEEIARVLPRLPYDPAEVRAARTAVEMWQRQGHNVALAPLSAHYQQSSQEQRMNMQREWFMAGLLFITAGDHGMQLLTIKTDAGRGFFGGQKVRYACYMSSGDDKHNPVGNAGSLTMAITKLSPILRI